MPLERSDAILDLSDPNLVLGPRKRRPTERLLENGDPLACKKGRIHVSATNVSADKENLTSSSPPIDTTPPSSQSTDLTDSTESGDDDTSNGDQAIVVDDSNEEGSSEGEVTKEDDEAELGT
jgi:hypothetical protein